MWAQIAKACLPKGEADPFYSNKLVVGRYFVERIIPEGTVHLAKLKTGSATLMRLPAEAF
jgi:hypothetical protein